MSSPTATNRLARRLRLAAFVVVVCAFGVIIAIVVGKYWAGELQAATARMKADEIAKACDKYMIDHGEYPHELADLLAADQNGKGPYVTRDTLTDPWGQPYRYDLEGSHRSGRVETVLPDVYCTSPNGRTFFAR